MNNELEKAINLNCTDCIPDTFDNTGLTTKKWTEDNTEEQETPPKTNLVVYKTNK